MGGMRCKDAGERLEFLGDVRYDSMDCISYDMMMVDRAQKRSDYSSCVHAS